MTTTRQTPNSSVWGADSAPHTLENGQDGVDALDPEVVGRLERLGHDVGEDLMGQLTPLFLADADARVVDLREALVTGDAEAIVRSAHPLRGASGNVGAAELARVCAALEATGAAQDLALAPALLGAVEAELERVRAALLARLARASTPTSTQTA